MKVQHLGQEVCYAGLCNSSGARGQQEGLQYSEEVALREVQEFK